MSGNEHEVNFRKYCDICKHRDLPEWEDPCNDCLAEPSNIDSKKPIYFKERD